MSFDYAAATQQLRRYFRRKGLNPATADDLTQETFLTLVSAVQRGKLPNQTDTVLYKTAAWTLGHHWRSQAANPEDATGEFPEDAKLIQLYTDDEGKTKAQSTWNRWYNSLTVEERRAYRARKKRKAA